MDEATSTQLALLQELTDLLSHLHIRFWLRGGWAVDFLQGKVTRPHSDIDLVAWLRHRQRLRRALVDAGYDLSRELTVQTDFRARGQVISVIFLTRTPEGQVITHGVPEWTWPAGALVSRKQRLGEFSAYVVSPERLLWEKESYEAGTGRPPHPKDVESMSTLRRMIAARTPGSAG